MIVTRKMLEYRIRNAFCAAYSRDIPIYSLTFYNQLEIHTGGWRERVEKIGFAWIKEGYFSDIYQLPESMQK